MDFHVIFVHLGAFDLHGNSKQSFSDTKVANNNSRLKGKKCKKIPKVGKLKLFIYKFFLLNIYKKIIPNFGFYNRFADIIIFLPRNYQLNCKVLLCLIGSA